MTETCDPNAGWFGKGHTWALCRGVEDYCIEATLVDVSETQARLTVSRIGESDRDEIIASGSYKEYTESDYTWRVYVNGVNKSQALASVRICYSKNETPATCTDYETKDACEAAGCYWYDGSCHASPQGGGGTTPCSDHSTAAACEAAGCYWYDGSCHASPQGGGGESGAYTLPLYGSVTVLGHKFTNNRLECELARAIIQPEELAAKTLVVGGAGVIFAVGSLILPGSVATTGVIMGGIYVALKSIDAACTEATVDIFNAAYTEEDHDDVVQTVTDKTDGTFTPSQIEDATKKAEDKVKKSKEEKQRQEDVKSGKKTPEQAEQEREAQIADEATQILFADNFSLEIPAIVMAGDVNVSGLAPKQSQKIEICAKKRFFGFDWLAADDVLATTTSDSEYKYTAALTLDEFGIIDVYARIPHAWWDVLEKDLTTKTHTVFVVTWEFILFLIIAAALIYDKKTGKLGLLKRKR